MAPPPVLKTLSDALADLRFSRGSAGGSASPSASWPVLVVPAVAAAAGGGAYLYMRRHGVTGADVAGAAVSTLKGARTAVGSRLGAVWERVGGRKGVKGGKGADGERGSAVPLLAEAGSTAKAG